MACKICSYKTNIELDLGYSPSAISLLEYANDKIKKIFTLVLEYCYKFSNIKIKSEAFAKEQSPDYFLLTAWNYKDEIINKVRSYGNNDSIFIIPFPNLKIL